MFTVKHLIGSNLIVLCVFSLLIAQDEKRVGNQSNAEYFARLENFAADGVIEHRIKARASKGRRRGRENEHQSAKRTTELLKMLLWNCFSRPFHGLNAINCLDPSSELLGYFHPSATRTAKE